MAINLPIVSKFDDRGVNSATKSIDSLHKSVKLAGAAILAAFSVSAITDVASQLIRVGEESQAASRLLANAASNAGVFGASAKEIGKATGALEKHSEQLALITGLDDELITQMKATWLAVPDLAAMGADGLNNLAKVAADVAAGTGKDFTAIGNAFIKVAGDEETAMSKLRRQGIVLADSQQQVYESLLKTSGEAAANSYLIDLLGKKYAGAAEAGATASGKLAVAWENIQENLAMALLPAAEAFSDWLIDAMPTINKVVTDVVGAFQWFGEQWDTYIVKPFQDFVSTHKEDFIAAWDAIEEALRPFKEIIWPAHGAVLLWLGGIIKDNVITAFEDFAAWLGDPNNKLIIQIMTGIIGAMVTALLAIPIAAAAAIALLTVVINLLSEANKKWNEFWGNAYKQKGQAGSPWGTSSQQWRPGSGQSLVPGMATGGVASMGGLSWVGEKGPELLSLPKGATVTPIPQHMRADNLLGSRGSSTANYAITVNAGVGSDGAKIGEEIVNYIRRFERTSGRVFASA